MTGDLVPQQVAQLHDAAALSARYTAPEQVAAKWLLTYQAENTRAAYRRDVVHSRGAIPAFLEWCRELALDPWSLDLATFTLWLRSLDPHEVTNATRRRKVSAVRGLFDYAATIGVLPASPIPRTNRYLHLGSVPRESQTRGLTRSESAAMLEAGRRHSQRDAAVLAMLYHQGLRASELCDLTTASVIYDRGRWALVVEGKGRKRRTVGLNPAVKHELDLWEAERTAQGFLDAGLALIGAPTADRPLFVQTAGETHPGQALDRFRVRTIVSRAARAAGVEQWWTVSPHSFRHTCTTHLRKAGVSDDDIQVFLGHESPETTKRYGRRDDSLAASPADRLRPLEVLADD